MDQTGKLLFYCDLKRLLFYVNKKLAKYVDPKTIQLIFTPGGPGYQLFKENKCVICGTEKELTRHHSVPTCYVKYFPKKFKDHKTEDIVCLCSKCHASYEVSAEEYKKELLFLYGFDLNAYEKKYRTIQLHHKYLRYNQNLHKIPDVGLERFKCKINRIENDIIKLTGKLPKTEEMKHAIALYKYDMYKQFHECIKHDIENFIQLWKNHFKEYLANKGVIVDK